MTSINLEIRKGLACPRRLECHAHIDIGVDRPSKVHCLFVRTISAKDLSLSALDKGLNVDRIVFF